MQNNNATIQKVNNVKVALVHDFLLYSGGAEKVLEVLCEMFPEAPIYTLLYDKEKMRGKFEGKDIRTSFLQNFPKFLRKHHRWLLPFLPTAPETFDLRDFDVVISSSGAWSKGIVTKLNTIHIAYLHSPMRFVWDYNERYLKEAKSEKRKAKNFFVRLFLSYLRLWDYEAAQRPDYLIANSKYTQERIKKYYRRESEIIYPPVTVCHSERNESAKRLNVIKESTSGSNPSTSSVADFIQDNNKKYFLVVSRMSLYKKIDVIVEAFNKLGLPLIIVGEGKQEKYLRKIAKNNVKILGWQSDEKLKEYYQNARAFVFAAEDDFGIAIVEAMNCGVPVIVFEKGGAKEIIKEGIAGEFFGAQTVEVIADGVRRFIDNEKNYNKETIIARAKEFSKKRFEIELRDFIEDIMRK